MKQTKLSKQQKEILKVLYKHQKKKQAFKYGNREVSRKVYAEQHTTYPKHGVLNPSHSASISRSARRLENRGLIRRNKPVFMSLTDKGMKYSKSLFGEIKKKKYKEMGFNKFFPKFMKEYDLIEKNPAKFGRFEKLKGRFIDRYPITESEFDENFRNIKKNRPEIIINMSKERKYTWIRVDIRNKKNT